MLIPPVAALALLIAASACSGPGNPGGGGLAPVQMRLPEGEAGRVVRRAIEAAGGWDRWQRLRGAEFVATLTVFTASGEVASETIFLHRIRLHRPGVRVDSIGLIDEVVFGFDGSREWMLRGGRAVTSITGTAFTRFHAIADAFWFSLPFVLAERSGELTYAGALEEDGKLWERVRVAYDDATLPMEWMVLYFDAETGLIGKVHARVIAEFLTHPLWIARLRDYREIDGIRRERRRLIYAADEAGRPLGVLAAEGLIEHIRFNDGWPEALFTAPLAAGGGSPAG